MDTDTARTITAERLALWCKLVESEPVTPAALIWLHHKPDGGTVRVSCTRDLNDFDLADLFEGIARSIRFQARDKARRGHV